jgi:hypothetical protein
VRSAQGGDDEPCAGAGLCKYVSTVHTSPCYCAFSPWPWTRKTSFYIGEHSIWRSSIVPGLCCVTVSYSLVPLRLPTPLPVQSRMVWGQALRQQIGDGKTHTCADRPVHAVVCALAVAGFLLLSTSRAWPGLFRPPRDGAGYVEIPLEDREGTGTYREVTPERGAHVGGLGPRISRLLLIATVCALSVRIELFRRISKATECTISSVEVTCTSQTNRRIRLTDN